NSANVQLLKSLPTSYPTRLDVAITMPPFVFKDRTLLGLGSPPQYVSMRAPVPESLIFVRRRLSRIRVSHLSAENQPDLGTLTRRARLHSVRINAGQKIGQPVRKRLLLQEKSLPDPDIRQ